MSHRCQWDTKKNRVASRHAFFISFVVEKLNVDGLFSVCYSSTVVLHNYSMWQKTLVVCFEKSCIEEFVWNEYKPFSMYSTEQTVGWESSTKRRTSLKFR